MKTLTLLAFLGACTLLAAGCAPPPPPAGVARTTGAGPAAVRDLDRILLHARRLGFVHPVTGAALRFDVLPPSLYEGILELLRA